MNTRTPAVMDSSISATPARRRNRGRPATPFLRERILDSASLLFAERDFDQVLIDDVAANAHVGKGSVYRHFNSKEELYAAVVIAGFDQLQEQIRDALGGTRSVRDRIATIIRHALQFFWNRRQFFALLRDPKALPPAQERRFRTQREKLVGMLSEVLRAGAEHGTIRADLDTRLVAEAALGMVRGLNRYGREFATPEIAVDTIIAIFMDGCAVERSAEDPNGETIEG